MKDRIFTKNKFMKKIIFLSIMLFLSGCFDDDSGNDQDSLIEVFATVVARIRSLAQDNQAEVVRSEGV